MKEAQALVESLFSINRCFFLASDSEANWFKRSTNKIDTRNLYCMYGNCSKKYGYVIPMAMVWPDLVDLILRKAGDIVPNVGPSTKLKDIYKLMCFDKIYQNGPLADEADNETMLVELYLALPARKRMKFLQGAKTWFEELNADPCCSDEPNPRVVNSSEGSSIVQMMDTEVEGACAHKNSQGGSQSVPMTSLKSIAVVSDEREDQQIFPTNTDGAGTLSLIGSEDKCANNISIAWTETELGTEPQNMELTTESGSASEATNIIQTEENRMTNTSEEKESCMDLRKNGRKKKSLKSAGATLRSKRKRN